MVPLIRLNEFWPFFETSEYRRFDYTSIDNSASASSAPPLTAVFSYDLKTSSMLVSEFSDKGVQKIGGIINICPVSGFVSGAMITKIKLSSCAIQ